MRLTGSYRVVATSLWSSLHGLGPYERLVLLALKTGSTSSFAGIGFVYSEALARETGLTVAEVEAALTILEKRPAPTTSWIVRDGPVIWVRNQLKADPVVQKGGGKPNPDQQKGIGRHVGALPQDNTAVVRFLRHYREMLSRTVDDTKPPTVDGTEGETVGATVGGSPASTPASAETTTPAVTPEAPKSTVALATEPAPKPEPGPTISKPSDPCDAPECANAEPHTNQTHIDELKAYLGKIELRTASMSG
jgi:hypothetical protein